MRRLGAGIALALSLVMASPGTAAASPWAIQPTPNPPDHSTFTALSCSAANACTAVGYTIKYGVGTLPLAQRWNGTGWNVQAMPKPTGATYVELHGVSCSAAKACTAVGYFTKSPSTGPSVDKTLAERWDGKSWKIQTMPEGAGGRSRRLFGVSCTSASSCTAVGYRFNGADNVALAERWDGTSWKVQPTLTPPGAYYHALGAVSCTGPDACTAVGYYYISTSSGVTGHPLAERWDGVSWKFQPLPPGGTLNSVSCSGPTSCTAVGSQGTDPGDEATLAEHWDGATWTVQPTPNAANTTDNVLYGVSCTATNACTAVGADWTDPVDERISPVTSTLAERWNGTSWKIQPTPKPYGSLLGVSCLPASACTAAGNGGGRPLAERHP